MSHKQAKAYRVRMVPMDKVREATKNMPGPRRRVSRGEFIRGTTQYREVKKQIFLGGGKHRIAIIITLAKCVRMVIQLAKRRGRWVLEA